MVQVIGTGNTRARWVREGGRGDRGDFILGPVDFQWVTENSDLELRTVI